MLALRLVPPAVLFVASCGGAGPEPASEPEAPLFRDATTEFGLPPAPDHWPDGTYNTPEAMQGGVGLFDYDGDGRLDIFHARIPVPGDPVPAIENRLWHQTEAGTFEDVTEAAGLTSRGFGQGLCIGDIDNDGDLDLYLANFGPDRLFRNEGDGTFRDITKEAGISGNRWSTAASFFDSDADGDLDLYVVHYLRYDREKRCTDPSSRPEYCGPRSFHGWADILYRNNGDGTFTNATAEAGIVLPEKGSRARGLGIIATDLTGDGIQDVFVANDAEANQLWVGQGDGTFVDEGILRGVAVNSAGIPEASMGVVAGDIDGDGTLDLFMTHLWEENNRLYLGSKSGLFRDRSAAASLTMHDLGRTGFGCAMFDYDNDGDLDLAVANGAIRRRPPLPGAPEGFWGEYAEPNQFFEGDGTGRFRELDASAGAFVRDVRTSRGLAVGDLDGDGDLDMVVSHVDNSLTIYRNELPPGAHWVSVRAIEHGRDALGAQLFLTAGGRTQLQAVIPAASYLSSNDPVVHFGLGSAASIEEIEVRWADGTRELFRGGEDWGVDRTLVLVRGEGEVQ
ncbi:MAG TPA: CRTAC1 family protein [Planctomycetes bacterium]|nr:CRTAC1 family protein [Planctomycetota bacterium]